MFKGVCFFRLEIELFLEIKVQYFPQVCDTVWICDFALSIDISQHYKEMTINLQTAN
jgi:hypothetical protein